MVPFNSATTFQTLSTLSGGQQSDSRALQKETALTCPFSKGTFLTVTQQPSITSLSMGPTTFKDFMGIIGAPASLVSILYPTNANGQLILANVVPTVNNLPVTLIPTMNVLPPTSSGAIISLASACVLLGNTLQATVGGSCPPASSTGDNTCGLGSSKPTSSSALAPSDYAALSTGGIVGIAIAAVIFFALLVGAVLVLLRTGRHSYPLTNPLSATSGAGGKTVGSSIVSNPGLAPRMGGVPRRWTRHNEGGDEVRAFFLPPFHHAHLRTSHSSISPPPPSPFPH